MRARSAARPPAATVLLALAKIFIQLASAEASPSASRPQLEPTTAARTVDERSNRGLQTTAAANPTRPGARASTLSLAPLQGLQGLQTLLATHSVLGKETNRRYLFHGHHAHHAHHQHHQHHAHHIHRDFLGRQNITSKGGSCVG